MRVCGAPDKFQFQEWASGNPPGGNTVTLGKAMRDPRFAAGQRVGVFIVAGQSNASNYTVGAAYVQTNPTKIHCLNIYDGGLYAATEPLLGCETYGSDPTRGNIFVQMADRLINTGVFDQIVLIPCAIGGTPVELWNTSFGNRLDAAFERAKAAGLTVTGVTWMQGEANPGATQLFYFTEASKMIARVRAKGFMAPWFIGLCTYFVGSTAPAVRAAQMQLVNGTDIFQGADTDTLTSAYRYDNGHFNSTTGAAAAATLWRNAIDAVF